MQIHTLANNNHYTLIDSGNFEKLERFGDQVLVRPEPQAVWRRQLPEAEWLKRADARFVQEGSHSGTWHRLTARSTEQWVYTHQTQKWYLKFRLGLTAFKHVGVFPEQALNWDYIIKQTRRLGHPQPKVLNAFAYTGGASLAARVGGGDVVHLDAVKQVVNWANENMQLNTLNGIRWLVEDALTFIRREAKRGNVYQGVIMDPPSFGHGPKGERWKLEDQIDELVAETAKLLDPKRGFLVLNGYSLGFSALLLEGLVRTHFSRHQLDDLEAGELALIEQIGKRKLPTGVFVRFVYDSTI
jgi:23S rRNA (cytosine1962-C5)-methyltransferase